MSSKKKTSKKSARSGETAAATGGKTAPAAKKKVSKKKTVAAKPAPAPAPATEHTAATRTESVSKSPVQAPTGGTSGSGVVRLALFASLLALVIAAYAAYQFTLSGSVTSAQVTALEERLAFAVQQQQSLQSSFDQQNQKVTTDTQSLGTQLAGMQSTVDALKLQSEQSVDDIKANLGESVARWKLDELHSLLTRINRAYQLTGDQAQALAGLRLAQASVATIDNPYLEAVNTALAEDILQVESARQVDIASLHSRLLGMTRMIPDLTLAADAESPDEGETQAPADTAAQETDDSGILAASKTLISDIGGLVKYKNLEAPLQPSLDDEARFVLYESLNLNLQGAMAALLRRDNPAYQAQLEVASDALGAWFDAEQGAVKTFADQLEVMRSYDVSMNAEAISQALAALDRVIVLEH